MLQIQRCAHGANLLSLTEIKLMVLAFKLEAQQAFPDMPTQPIEPIALED